MGRDGRDEELRTFIGGLLVMKSNLNFFSYKKSFYLDKLHILRSHSKKHILTL